MMENLEKIPPEIIYFRHRFLDRHKLLTQSEEITSLANQVRDLLNAGKTADLRSLLNLYYPPDLVDVMEFLDDAQDRAVFDLLDTAEAADVLDELDDCTKESLILSAETERLARIVEALPSDEGADILGYLPAQKSESVLNLINSQDAKDLRFLLGFPKESAGGIMSLGYVSILESDTVGEALRRFKETPDVESIFSIYILDGGGVLQGVVDLRTLMSARPDQPVGEIMNRGILWVHPDMDQEDVARIFARYDLNSLPVVEKDPEGRLVGVITSDDVIDVIEHEDTEDTMRMAGSDAEEMERRPPVRIALLRLPWILATMFIELLAGFVIHHYDATLARILLLASFMPIISAISGNTGLQSATIIVRGISTGSIRVTEWRRAILRQLVMTMILGGVTGLILGTIGAIWYGKWTFGVIVFLGMFAAVNIAGVVGTVVPLTSKSLGFDPAITSGPFETAFQDVIGISIFLSLATFMLRYL